MTREKHTDNQSFQRKDSESHVIPVLQPYFVQKADPSHSADLSSVVHETHISLRGGVKLSDLNATEALEEFPPYV